MPATATNQIGPRLRSACVAAACLAGSPASATEFGTFAPYAGAPASPVHAKDLDGRPFAIGATDDRVTLVHFFASWCEPCEDELPKLAAFIKAHGDRIRLIGVNVAEPASRARKFAARFGLSGPVAVDDDKAVANAFHVRGLPATVALAPGGVQALAVAGPLDWSSPRTAETLAGLGR